MIIRRLPLSCWPALTDLVSRFGNFEAFFSTGPKAAKPVALDIMHDLPVLVVERPWKERDFTEVDALGRILEFRATDATRSCLGYRLPLLMTHGLLRHVSSEKSAQVCLKLLLLRNCLRQLKMVTIYVESRRRDMRIVEISIQKNHYFIAEARIHLDIARWRSPI